MSKHAALRKNQIVFISTYVSSSFFLEKGKSRLANLCHASSTQAIWMSDCSIKMRAFFLGPLASGPDWIPTTSRKTAQWDDFGWSDLYNDYELWFMKIPNWQRKCGTVEYRWSRGLLSQLWANHVFLFKKFLTFDKLAGIPQLLARSEERHTSACGKRCPALSVKTSRLFGYIVVFAAATAHCTHSFSSIPFALRFERAQIAQSADRALRRRKGGGRWSRRRRRAGATGRATGTTATATPTVTATAPPLDQWWCKGMNMWRCDEDVNMWRCIADLHF